MLNFDYKKRLNLEELNEKITNINNLENNEFSLNRIELTKNTKGYGWSIKVEDKDMESVIKRIKETNIKLKTLYGNSQ